MGFDHGVYATLQFDAAYRLFPALAVGGAVEVASAGTSDDSCADGNNCPPNYVAFGPRVEASPADSLVAPWIGGGFAMSHLYPTKPRSVPASTYFEPVVLESTWDVGLAIRPTRGFAIGPCLAVKFFLTEPYEYHPPNFYDDPHRIVSLQLRVMGRL